MQGTLRYLLEISEFFGLPSTPTGNSGSLTINTPLLRLMNKGAISVENNGAGAAGDLLVNAPQFF
jgi:large exoprotein involved in heme utilization and adhesion